MNILAINLGGLVASTYSCGHSNSVTFGAGEEIFLVQIGLQIQIPGAKICLKLP